MVVGTFDGRGPAPEFTGSVMFVDPSGSGRDETAWAIVKMCMGRMYLTSSDGRLQGFAPETLKAIVDDARRNKVNTVVVEPNYGGGMFTEMLKAAFIEHGYPCSVEDAEWARGQKELRIIDVLEPLFNQHRIVIDRAVIEKDLKAAANYDIGVNEKPAYQLVYQMTRLTRERECIPHYDRIEALAGACHYYIEQAGASADQARKAEEGRIRDEEYEKFLAEFDDDTPPGQPDIPMRA